MPNWRTAIVRKKMSRPTTFLADKDLLKGKRMLDYGCGKSIDYLCVKNLDRYDPHWWNVAPKGKYNTIICNYVLNVVTKEEQKQIIDHIKTLLTKNGKAYFTVRRDIKQDIHYKDYSQRVVKLPFKSIVKNSAFEIYEYTNDSKSA